MDSPSGLQPVSFNVAVYDPPRHFFESESICQFCFPSMNLSLYYHYIMIMISLYCHYTIVILSLCYHYDIIILSLYHRYIIIMLLLYYHYIINIISNIRSIIIFYPFILNLPLSLLDTAWCRTHRYPSSTGYQL